MINIDDMNIKKCNKKMGLPCLFTRQRALKMGYFYWLRVKNYDHLHTELSLGYAKDAKFYLDSKASFIDISSIHLSCFWLLGSGNIALFFLKYNPVGDYFPKKICSTIKLLFLLQICSLLDCS